MLIEFSVENYLSFKQRATFSMLAAPLGNLHKHHCAATSCAPLLKSAVLYGANASGKTNLLRAMNFMRVWVRDSVKETQAEDPIPVERFRLSTETDTKPCRFEVVFVVDSVIYRYLFATDSERIHEESLVEMDGETSLPLFQRNGTDIKVYDRFEEGRELVSKVRLNSLFLSVVAQFNGPKATAIIGWFQRLRFHLDDDPQLAPIANMLSDAKWKEQFLRFVRCADSSVLDVLAEETRPPPANPPVDPSIDSPTSVLPPPPRRRFRLPLVYLLHPKYNAEGEVISQEPIRFRNESAGTQKFLTLLVPILETLRGGFVLMIDELDTRFHTLLVRAIVELFNSEENPGAQLIFATHGTSMLDRRFFRPDQVWFSEKDTYGATDLYSLIEYSLPENAFSERDYIQGKYGAIPFLGDFRLLLSKEEGS